MKAEIIPEGKLVLVPETQTEIFAINMLKFHEESLYTMIGQWGTMSTPEEPNGRAVYIIDSVIPKEQKKEEEAPKRVFSLVKPVPPEHRVVPESGASESE